MADSRALSVFAHESNLEMLSNEQMNEHNRLYETAVSLIRDEILIHNAARGPVGFLARRKLNRAIRLLTRVIEIREANWSAMWMIGKAYQRLGNQETALGWFSRALQIDSSNPNVSREATVCALELGHGQKAVAYALTALEANPVDVGLTANLALAYLIAGDSDLAQEKATEAVARDPQDAISQRVLRMIGEVRAGSRQQPRCMGDLIRPNPDKRQKPF
jgi:tetratricopeptide (TPR) repeat protein